MSLATTSFAWHAPPKPTLPELLWLATLPTQCIRELRGAIDYERALWGTETDSAFTGMGC